jgi:hypothetical protein
MGPSPDPGNSDPQKSGMFSARASPDNVMLEADRTPAMRAIFTDRLAATRRFPAVNVVMLSSLFLHL